MVGIEYLYILKLLAALGSELIAGVFFAFSTFVMKALAQQPAAQGIATMQTINITVINPWFMTIQFFGADYSYGTIYQYLLLCAATRLDR